MKVPSNNRNHKPQLINPRSWPDIEQHYIDLNNHGWQLDPLLELVRHIIASNLAARLSNGTA
jgi:hypothetical protein